MGFNCDLLNDKITPSTGCSVSLYPGSAFTTARHFSTFYEVLWLHAAVRFVSS